MTTKIGFQTKASQEEENEDIIKTDQIENYTHKISLFGLPVFKSTKFHQIDSKQVGK
jgi:hypothetical protein